ncbi:MAG TPA: PDZ domain-containing protein [Candidatus Aquilonibacter sp.]|nr:PDZ domain-containing protein [Candidatus Aquilonibacter sp.]
MRPTAPYQEERFIRCDWPGQPSEGSSRPARPARPARSALRHAVIGLALALLLPLSIPQPCAAASGRTIQRPPGYLGIEFHDLTKDQAASMHLRDSRGVEVLLVDHDGPAAAAGLQPHDLITGLNGHIVASGEALRRMIREAGAGVQVRLSVFRNGNPITIRARLANRVDVERQAWARVADAPPPSLDATIISGDADGSAITPPPSPPAVTTPHSQGFIDSLLHGPFTGLELQAMPTQLAVFFGAPKGQGLLVQSVADGSPAASAGVHAGDVILRVDARPMRSTSDWNKHLHAVKGKPMTLDVLRDHRPMTVTLQPDTRKH